MRLLLNGEIREVFVEYKKKKNISLSIDPEGFITIRAPIGITEEDLDAAITPLIPKIEKKLNQIAANKRIWEDQSYNDDEHFILFREYLTFEEVGISKENREEQLRKFYYDNLKVELESYLKKYSKLLNLKYKEYKITETKTTWGTCNTSKKLTFNLKLAMAPKEVIEYVVVHELAHLKHMNHDRSFWSLVGKYIPDYKDRQEYLKKFGQFMNL